MKEILPGYDCFGLDICKVLGIDTEGIQKLTFQIDVDNIVRVEIVRHIYREEANKIVDLMKENYTFDAIKKSNINKIKNK